MPTHYEILGLQESATDDEIKKAFRKLASELHPDKNPGDLAKEARFKEVNQSYQVLSDAKAKSDYDGQLRVRSHFAANTISQEFLREIFNVKINGSQRVRSPSHPIWSQNLATGQDLEGILELTLEEAAQGCRKSITVQSPRATVPCTNCDGNGAEPGSTKIFCFACGGSGKGVHVGFSSKVGQCRQCKGHGFSPSTRCKSCSGDGKMVYRNEILVTVPLGVEEGQRIRLAGQGTPGSPPGDLFLTVKVSPHDRFVRRGRDLSTVVKLPISVAIRGGSISSINLFGQSFDIQIAPMTQSDAVVTLPGQGIRGITGRPGDLTVHLLVTYPEKVSARAGLLLDELAHEMSMNDHDIKPSSP